MKAPRNRPILVTGSHRSGSTWVGRMLASPPRVRYLQEPFNLEFPLPGCPARWWFQHVTAADAPQFTAYLRPLLHPRQPWWTPRGLKRLLLGCRTLMKDPIALFSAEWLARTFDMDMVVLIRHPAAFASSLVRLGWAFDFRHLVEQPRLMDDLLAPFRGDVERGAASAPPLLDQAILLWRLFHHVILRYRQRYPTWIFLRHEDLSRRPEEEFARLFQRLGLPLTERVRRTIRDHSAADNPGEADAKVVHQLRRNSRDNVWSWSRRLPPADVLRIRRGTEDVGPFFYADADWRPPDAAGRLAG